MKALIAVVSCHAKPEMRDLIRQTWVPMLPAVAEHRFFLGKSDAPYTPKPDEVMLNCNDTYYGLIEKVQCISRWAYDNGYDFMMKCDDDVVLKPVELMASGVDEHDFVGSDNGDMLNDSCRHCGKSDCRQTTGKYITPWGFCYWISRKSMNLLYNAELPSHGSNDECWVAHVLGDNGILMHHDNRYFIHTGMNPNEEPPEEAAPGKQYTYVETREVVKRLGRPNRFQSTLKVERIEIPVEEPSPSGHTVLPNEVYRQNGWLVRSKFTEVQATPDTFAFCIHLVWKGYHVTPKEEIMAEFTKVFLDPKIVWFDRRAFGGGSWRKVTQ